MKKTFLKSIISYSLRSLAGSFIYVIAMIIPGLFWPINPVLITQLPADELSFQIPSLLICGFIFSLVLIYFFRKSRLKKGRAILLLSLFFYGTITFMAQIESLYFIEAFPLMDTETLIQLLILPFFTNMIYIPLLSLISGKKENEVPSDFSMSDCRLLPVLLLSPIYVAIYLLFGRYIAYASEELRHFYSGWEISGALTEMLPLFQIFRGFLWTGFSWLAVSQFTRKREAVIGLSLFYAFSLSIQLIVPNPFMPAEIRFYHGIETFLSMLLYGFISAFLLTRRIELPFRKKKSSSASTSRTS